MLIAAHTPFSLAGNNIWIHDCSVWNQDDTFCIKDGTTNVVVERVQVSEGGRGRVRR